MVRRLLFLITYFSLPIILIIAVLNSNPSYYGVSGFIPMVLGTVAFTLLNMQLVLAARPKWLEKHFGLDRFYQFHTLIAVIAILAAFIHKLVKSIDFPESIMTQMGDIAIGVFIFAAVMSLIFMADTLARRFKLISTVRDYFLKWKFTKHNIQLLLHNVNLLAVILIFIHVMLSSSAQNQLVRCLYISYSSTALLFYTYHKFIRRFLPGKRFTVEEVIHESDSMTTIVLCPDNGKVFSYIPGQFGFIRIYDQAVSAEEHPFSISSSPLNRQNVSVTIKRLGDWTSAIQSLQKGCKATFDAPYGRFSPSLSDCTDGAVLIAGGVGITPMLSMMRYFAETNKSQKVILIWGLKNRGEMICANEFMLFQSEMPNFRFIPVMSSDPEFPGEKGRISRELIQRTIDESGFELSKLHFFFCGPPLMWPGVRESLSTMNIKQKMIHRENFSL